MKRGDRTNFPARIKHEKLLRSLFIEAGGKPIRKNPIYMILGDSPTGPHDLNNDYGQKTQLPLAIFKSDIISFTYPDSMYKINLNELDRLNLENIGTKDSEMLEARAINNELLPAEYNSCIDPLALVKCTKTGLVVPIEQVHFVVAWVTKKHDDVSR